MTSLTTWALASLSEYGVPILVFISFIGSLGIPFPISAVIIAAGAFARSGVLDWRWALAACLLGAALADQSEYLLGRFAQSWLKKRFSHQSAWIEAKSAFDRQGGKAIFLTRFWLTPLAPVINVIAGGTYSYARFLVYDIAGQALWVMLYGGAGYLFAAQWELVSQQFSAICGISTVLMIFALVGFTLWKHRKRSAV